MKKIWFKRKMYGWGWTFGTWESVLVMAIYIALNIYIFAVIDAGSHSGSDAVMNFTPRFLLLTVALYLVCYSKGEKPRWPALRRRLRQGEQWGNPRNSLVEVLKSGGVAGMATDTTYGIVGSGLNEKTVNEIYRLRKRDLDKPFIVLIADRDDLKKFGAKTTPTQEKILDRVWAKTISSDEIVRPTDSSRFRPGPTSVILPCPNEKFSYLHRGKQTIAFRLPNDESLRAILREAGPLVAPSANPQGHPVAKTISEARAYFGHHINVYQDGGTVVASLSKLIDITDGTEKVIRA